MSGTSHELSCFNLDAFKRVASGLLGVVSGCPSFEVARDRLRARVSQINFDAQCGKDASPSRDLIRMRDCSTVANTVLSERSDARAGFSVAQALWDIAMDRARDDLQPGFFAELIHLIRGLEGRAKVRFLCHIPPEQNLEGRDIAIARSRELDRLWGLVETSMARFSTGLSEDAQARRNARKDRILKAFGGSPSDWGDWTWQLHHVITNVETLQRVVSLDEPERRACAAACANGLPFGITPYYASLMDDEGEGRDRAIRAQVLPPQDYVDFMVRERRDRSHSCDFMLESATSPIELITRRYPAIVILKPFNTCPQICVYCQRNWEIEHAMAPGALASADVIASAIRWIEQRPAIREVLVTGGDPGALSDNLLEGILSQVASIPSVDLIRLGTRTPVTMPMRITDRFARILGSFREPGRRDVVVVTHIEHPYEITMDTVNAIERLRRAGLGVYNQQVFTFFVSRRFESTTLRMVLRQIGIDPYYTFATKGKRETDAYRVPIARILQEQKEEARLMPGTRRTDEAVYNVPGLGKNYLRAQQNRDLLSILPNGSRVYEFHPWEKNILEQDTYVGTDVPILSYLQRLVEIGEDPEDYESIWYYF